VPGEWMTQKGIDSSRPVTEASRAKVVGGMHASIHSEFTGSARHSRTQWFYGLFRDLPGDRLSCHRRLAKTGASARLGVSAFARLDAGTEASGPHDFTVRSRLRQRLRRALVPVRRSFSEGGISAVRQRAGDRSRETRPAIPCAPNAAASTASRPNVRDDGQRPSLGTGCRWI
jgi:hypothetical protein